MDHGRRRPGASACSASSARSSPSRPSSCSSTASPTTADAAERCAADASAAIDQVRARFGSTAIGPASALSTDGRENCPPRATQWGTNEPSGSETPETTGPRIEVALRTWENEITPGARPSRRERPARQGGQMPLSENEQRILRQIEQQLERDPTFSTRGYQLPRRRVLLLSLALVAAPGDDGAAARRSPSGCRSPGSSARWPRRCCSSARCG